MGVMDSAGRVQPEDRADWRRWLVEHGSTSTGVWLVLWRPRSGRAGLTYDQAVLEAMAFGWVDAQARALDDDRSMLWLSPRKPGSGWAATNKARVELLVRDGLMAEAGQRVVDAAKADGSWTLLDDVENLLVPSDLDAAFDALPGSRQNWDAFPRSVRRAILQWIVLAKRPETRAKRVAETATLAGRNERAHQQAGG